MAEDGVCKWVIKLPSNEEMLQVNFMDTSLTKIDYAKREDKIDLKGVAIPSRYGMLERRRFNVVLPSCDDLVVIRSNCSQEIDPTLKRQLK